MKKLWGMRATVATKAWGPASFLAALALVMLISGTVHAQSNDNDGCSAKTLSGDYAFRISGQVFNADGSVTLRDGVAMTSFDGDGKLTQVDFVMANGTAVPGPADPTTGFHILEKGSYTVYSDCTGSAVINFPAPPGLTSGAVIKLAFVLSHHGRTIHTIVSELIPPGSNTPVPANIHSDAEKLDSRDDRGDDRR